jgi:hypothetical protein
MVRYSNYGMRAQSLIGSVYYILHGDVYLSINRQEVHRPFEGTAMKIPWSFSPMFFRTNEYFFTLIRMVRYLDYYATKAQESINIIALRVADCARV